MIHDVRESFPHPPPDEFDFASNKENAVTRTKPEADRNSDGQHEGGIFHDIPQNTGQEERPDSFSEAAEQRVQVAAKLHGACPRFFLFFSPP